MLVRILDLVWWFWDVVRKLICIMYFGGGCFFLCGFIVVEVGLEGKVFIPFLCFGVGFVEVRVKILEEFRLCPNGG